MCAAVLANEPSADSEMLRDALANLPDTSPRYRGAKRWHQKGDMNFPRPGVSTVEKAQGTNAAAAGSGLAA
jgi:hypothetical protein